jgi:hypothetical protein
MIQVMATQSTAPTAPPVDLVQTTIIDQSVLQIDIERIIDYQGVGARRYQVQLKDGRITWVFQSQTNVLLRQEYNKKKKRKTNTQASAKHKQAKQVVRSEDQSTAEEKKNENQNTLHSTSSTSTSSSSASSTNASVTTASSFQFPINTKIQQHEIKLILEYDQSFCARKFKVQLHDSRTLWVYQRQVPDAMRKEFSTQSVMNQRNYKKRKQAKLDEQEEKKQKAAEIRKLVEAKDGEWPPEHLQPPESNPDGDTPPFLSATHLASMKLWTHLTSKETLFRKPCVVCSCLIKPENYNEVRLTPATIRHMTETLFTSEAQQRDIPDIESHFRYNTVNAAFESLNGLPLQQSAMFMKKDKACVGMCSTCKRAVFDNKLPAWAIANDNFFGNEVPAVLTNLTWAESQLISLHRLIVSIKYNGYGDEPAEQQQRSLASHMIAFPNMTDQICNKLSLDVEDLLDTMKIVFVGQTRPTSDSMRWCCEVNRHKVRAALEWLIENHRDYKDFNLNDSAIRAQLEALPEGEVPDLLYQAVTLSLGDTYDTKVHGDDAGKADRDVKEAPDHDDQLRDGMTSSIAVGPDADHFNEDAEKVNRVRQLVMTAPYQDDAPVNTWHNPNMWTSLYPHLFVLGLGGPENQVVLDEDGNIDLDSSTIRRTKLPLEGYFERLANQSDQRFNMDRSFFGVAWDIIRRRELWLASRVLLNLPSDTDLLAKVTSVTQDDIKTHLLDFEYSAEAYEALPEEIKTLLRYVKNVGAKLRQSDHERRNWRHQVNYNLLFLKSLQNNTRTTMYTPSFHNSRRLMA